MGSEADASPRRPVAWSVAMFEVGRPPVVLETPYPLRSIAWLAALPYRLRDALQPGVTWRPVRVPGFSTVRQDGYARWHHMPPTH